MPREVTDKDWSNMAANERGNPSKQKWATPGALYNKLDEEFHFTLDAAAEAENAKHPVYITPEIDALGQNWGEWSGGGAVFVNPPYGVFAGAFLKKAYEESLRGLTVVVLIFARTDVPWFHEWIVGKASEIRFVEGRVKFEDAARPWITNSPFWPSMLVVYRPGTPGGEPHTTRVSSYAYRPIKSRKAK